MANMIDYSQVYAQLEEARKREKETRAQKLEKELDALVQQYRDAQTQHGQDLQQTSAEGQHEERKLKESTAGKGLLRSGYMDSLLEDRRSSTRKALDESRARYSEDKYKLDQKEESLRQKAAEDLSSIDSKYDNKLVSAQQKEQSQILSLEKAALAAAGKNNSGSDKDKDTDTDTAKWSTSLGVVYYPDGHQYTKEEIKELLKKRNLPADYVEVLLNQAVNYGNIRTFMEENSGKIIRKAGEDVWRYFMQEYKDLENWYRQVGKGSIK